MENLRRAIRDMINEGALGIGDLPDGWYVHIKEFDDVATVQLVDSNGRLHGEVGIQEPDRKTGPCDGSWSIVASHADKGWGPMLYDVAMEWASQKGKGLTPDRAAVSDDAYKVWDYYHSRRGDVKKGQLDSRKNVLTPDSGDNCAQISTATHAGGQFQDQLSADDLKGSPLAKYYSKAPKMTDALQKAGKLKVN